MSLSLEGRLATGSLIWIEKQTHDQRGREMRWKIADRRGRRYCGVGEELAIGVVVVVDAEAVDVQEGRRPTNKAAEPWSGRGNRGPRELWFV